MVTHAVVKLHIARFWDDEFKNLVYVNESFNDNVNVARWLALGYANKFTGDMCDMRSPQPSWNHLFVKMFEEQGWCNVSTSYYRMPTGTILPTHGDLYLRYIDMFGLQGQEHTIRRAVVFLEDWQPGHYAEYLDRPYTAWQAGDTVEWPYDTPHMAANMGPTPRYTLQITGHT
jgi:hypothetical protein